MYKFNQEQFDLLFEILKIRSHSQTPAEQEKIEFLENWIEQNIDNVMLQKDKFGNLYVTKGHSDIYPCFVAHVDISQDEVEDFSVYWGDGYIFGMNNKEMVQCGLGFDDGCGVMLNLLALQKFDNVKCFFSLSEEVGCIGSKNSNIDFFKDCSFLIQGDRNSYNRDVSYYTNSVVVVSDEFQNKSLPTLKKYGYSYQRCVYTDIGQLSNMGCGCCAINYSIGYIREHTNEEVMIIEEFENAVNFAFELVEKMSHKRWEYTPKKESYSKDYYDDWYFQKNTYSDVWHYSEHFKFNKSDEEWIQDSIAVGECPCCGSTNSEEGDSYEHICMDCNSVFNIPNEKRLEEIILNQSEYDN